jgi:SAM-dependent methyltransferase
MDASHIREFWDQRAREDAYFFVDNRREYGDPELGPFWDDGARDLDRLLDALEVRIEPDDAVLDVGCGVGRLTSVIAGRAARVCGLDVSSEMIALARQHHADLNVEWVVGNGTDLDPLPDRSFDLCISHVVFQHIPDPGVTLSYVREMGRVLTPGGIAAFQISNDPAVHVRERRRLRDLASGRRGPAGQNDAAWLGSAVDLGDLHVAAVESGLELERIVGDGTQFCLVRARRAS